MDSFQIGNIFLSKKKHSLSILKHIKSLLYLSATISNTGLDWEKNGPGIFAQTGPPQSVGHYPPVHHPCGACKYAYLLFHSPKTLQSWVVSAMDQLPLRFCFFIPIHRCLSLSSIYTSATGCHPSKSLATS